MRRGKGGFTLLEVLAVVLLTGVVLGIALRFYVNLSRASTRAADHTRDIRHATSLLDRIARDFEGAILIRKPADVDPLSHPWLFLAESQYSDSGADQIKFMTRSHRPRRSETHESDLSVVSYLVRRNDEDALELLRWSSPRLPEGLDRSFPRSDEPGAALLADGLASFGVTFLDEEGTWSSSWDSSQLIESSELPVAVEIEVAMATGDPFDADEPTRFRRRVLLPVRPLDLELLLDPEGTLAGGEAEEEEAAAGEEESEGLTGQRDREGRAGSTGDRESREVADGEGPTVGECLNPQLVVSAGGQPGKQSLQPYLDEPISNYTDFIRENNLMGYIRPECWGQLR
jgi:prepilin-type N-terminal cleavage/methylation domain-containing protein